MKPTINPFIKAMILICCSCAVISAFSIRRQKGTFSEANLCKIGKGTIVRKARSSIECFTKCLILLPNLCKSVKYMPEEQICNMYQEGFRYDYYETKNNSCMGYQLIQGTNFGCPKGFKYVTESNTCWLLKTGSFDWPTARLTCNGLHPKSHPIIMDSLQSSNVSSQYFKAVGYLNCRNTITPAYFCFWTAGQRIYINKVRQPFQWTPFPNQVITASPNLPWMNGEPNAADNGNPSCMHHYMDYGLDDYLCSTQFCVLCEINL